MTIFPTLEKCHHQFRHPSKPGVVTLPHPSRDFAPGTYRSIYRQAGWPWPPR
ncbi:MAG: type II toxin-antitoxin system HicA family toxin [Hyphomicrobiaceae bacterium]|nr:type II toxin-antitoxin system HicA family toxin [Hyphomicrobiaceae bacterium]